MRTLLLCALLITTMPVDARFLQQPLADVVDHSDSIVEATILSARVQEWTLRGKARQCGIAYEARVESTFKGAPTGVVAFASNYQLSAGSRQLLFLKAAEGDFPADVFERFPPKDETSRQQCIKALPRLKTNFLKVAEFLDLDRVRLSYWLLAPKELKPKLVSITEVETDGQRVKGDDLSDTTAPDAYALFLPYILETQVVEWPVLRAWLAGRFPNAR